MERKNKILQTGQDFSLYVHMYLPVSRLTFLLERR